MRKYIPTAVTVLAAFVVALLWHGLEAGDRDGYGLVTLGLVLVGLPVVGLCGTVAAVCARNIVGQIFGKIAIFVITVLALVIIMN